jgi:anti-anti-sigma regulatory factor
VATNLLDRSPQLAILQIEGALRAPVHGDLSRRVGSLLASGERQIELDLTRLSDLDAAGIGELIVAFNTATAACGTLQVTQPSRRVRTMLEAVGVLPLLSSGSRGRGPVGDHRSPRR